MRSLKADCILQLDNRGSHYLLRMGHLPQWKKQEFQEIKNKSKLNMRYLCHLFLNKIDPFSNNCILIDKTTAHLLFLAEKRERDR